jgi:hypothetical protein
MRGEGGGGVGAGPDLRILLAAQGEESGAQWMRTLRISWKTSWLFAQYGFTDHGCLQDNAKAKIVD